MEKRTELENKVLQLVNKKLDNVDGSDDFFILHSYSWFDNDKPTFSRLFLESENIDKCEKVNITFMDFEFSFEDGEPNIRIYTDFQNSVASSEFYKSTPRFLLLPFIKKKNYTTYYTNSHVTSITCGELKFKLTKEEHDDLFEKVKVAYEKNKLLAKELELNKVKEKIDLRLSKFED
jgi:hypothetical protein